MKKISNNKELNQLLHEVGDEKGKKNYINVAFLIDGNHTFLHCLEENQKKLTQLKKDVETKSKEDRIENFKNNIIRHSKKQLEKDPESFNKKMSEMIDRFYKDKDIDVERIERLQRFRGEDIAPFFSEPLFIFQNEFEDIFIESIGLNPKNTKLNKETFIFDANLPEIEFTIKLAKKEKQNSNKDFEKKYIDSHIKDFEEGLFPFYKEGKHIKAPYDTKKSYLDFLQKDALIGDDTEIILGKKYVNWRPRLSSNEKGVDTQLVIKGCEYANDEDTRIVCLVTNDGDFEPLVKHLQSKGKIVFLLALDRGHLNKPLKTAVGDKHLTLDHELFKTLEITTHYAERVYMDMTQRKMAEYFKK